MVGVGKSSGRYGRVGLVMLFLVVTIDALAELPTPVRTPVGASGSTPLQRLNDQVRSQQQQAQQELLERSRVAPQPLEPASTNLPMAPTSQAVRCRRQLNEIQAEERPQLSGDCRIWRREQFRPGAGGSP